MRLRSASPSVKLCMCAAHEFVHLVLFIRPADLDCQEVNEKNERPLGRHQKMEPPDCLQMSIQTAP